MRIVLNNKSDSVSLKLKTNLTTDNLFFIKDQAGNLILESNVNNIYKIQELLYQAYQAGLDGEYFMEEDISHDDLTEIDKF